jgi:hypothetical protein
LSGFPLQSSIKMRGGFSGAKRSSEGDAGLSSEDRPTTAPTSKGDAANDALGGLLGLHKRKKNAQQDVSGGGSDENVLLSATTEVSSFSSSTLDAALFEIPSGYRLVQEK